MSYVWSSGANIAYPEQHTAACGTLMAGLRFGGSIYSSRTEEYNGTAWSISNDLAVGRYSLAGAGTQSAGLSFGGNTDSVSAKTEHYDGSVWSSGGDLTTAREKLAGCGTQSAGLSFGGKTSVRVKTTEHYNGTAWSSGGDLTYDTEYLAGAGTQSAGLVFGGTTGSVSSVTEEYNGTSWSSGGSLNTGRYGLAGAGTQSASLSFGGTTGSVVGITESYNGTVWSNEGDLAEVRKYLGGCGTNSGGLAIAGYRSADAIKTTEEYDLCFVNLFSGKIRIKDETTHLLDGKFAINTPTNLFDGDLHLFKKTFNFFDGKCKAETTSTDFFDGEIRIGDETTKLFDSELYIHTLPGAWSSGGNLAIGRHSLGGCGAQTAGLNFGGEEDGDTTSSVCEEYNGTVWSTGGALDTGRRDLSGCGTQSAALNFGGIVSAGSKDTDITEHYDGTTWSVGGSLAVARKQLAGAGTQSAGLSFGGDAGDVLQTKTEEYNGTSWSAGGDLATAREWLAGAGTQTAGLSFGGYTTSQSAKAEEYNGTAWSVGGNLVTARSALGGAGVQTAGLSFGGTTGSDSVKTEEYNGTAWWTSGNLSTARHGLAGCGSDTAGLSLGGYSYLINTEEYNPGPSANFTYLFDGWVQLFLPGAEHFDGKINVGHFPTNPFDGELRIKDALAHHFSSKIKIFDRSSNFLDGWIHPLKLDTDFLDGKVKLQHAPTNIFDGIIKIKDAFSSLLDGKIRLWNEAILLLDGWIHLLKPLSNVFDGEVTIESPNAKQDFFDGKIQLGNETFDLFNGKTHVHTGLPNIWYYSSDLIYGRSYQAGAGTSTAGLCIGGGPSKTTQEYSGSVWSLGGNLSLSEYESAACGVQSAALNFGGFSASIILAKTEEYNGTSWSAGGDLLSSRRLLAGAGTQSAGLCFGGRGFSISAGTEEYNGTEWSSGGNLGTARYSLAGAGTQSAGLGICGYSGSGIVAITEEYDGTDWSSGGNSGNAKYQLCGCGSQTSALNFMGIIEGHTTAITEEYNGASWVSASSLNSSRCRGGGCGTTESALAFGGYNSYSSTEVYDFPPSFRDIFDGKLHLFELDILLFDSKVVVTPPGMQEFDGRIYLLEHESDLFNGKTEVVVNKVWLASINCPARSFFGGVGTQTAGFMWSGYNGSYVHGYGYKYNGTTWSNGPNLSPPLGEMGFAGGDSTALSICGGQGGGSSTTACYELTPLWTSGPDVGYGRLNPGSCGPQTSALCAGGELCGQDSTILTQEYDGSTWSSGGDLNTSMKRARAVGTQNAALWISGSPLSGATEEYNGTTWSLSSELTRIIGMGAAAGVQSAALFFGNGVADEYDGTSWAQIRNLNYSRSASGGFGTVDAALSLSGLWGGQQYPYECNWLEEYGFAWYSVFDGKVQIKDITTDLFDGRADVITAETKLFDGKVNLAYFGSDSFDSKLKLYHTWRESLLGGFGEPYKIDFNPPLGLSSMCSIIYTLVVTESRKILLGFGETIEYLLHIPIAQNERQLLVNDLSNFINIIQFSINTLTVGDPFSGNQKISSSLQSGAGILSVHNDLSTVLVGLQKTINSLLIGDPLFGMQGVLSSLQSDVGILSTRNDLSSVLVGVRKLINTLTMGDPFSGDQKVFSSLQSDAGVLSARNDLSDVLTGVKKLINELTDNISNRISLVDELALKEDSHSLLTLLGSISSSVVLYPNCILDVYLDGVPISPKQITSLSFTMDRGVTFDVLSFSSVDPHLYANLQMIVGDKDSSIEVQYQGTSWMFLVEEVSGYELSFNVWGRSMAASKSDAPFKDSTNFVLETNTLASSVAEDLIPELSVIWNTVDWTISAGWSIDGTPIQMLKSLADSVGAVVRSYPDGTGFYVDEKYPVRPVNLPYAASAADFDRDTNLISLDASRELGTGVNAVTVHGYSPITKHSIRLEADSCVDVGEVAEIKVYPALSGIGYTLKASDGVPVYHHRSSEEHVEMVNFTGGKGLIGYPIASLKSIIWDGVVPAGFECTPGQNEIVLTDDTLVAVGEVTYSTEYDVWHGTHVGEGELLVVCYLDESGGIVARVYFGDGDHEADDIDRPILTSIESAVAVGQAFLDDTSYSKQIRSVVVPCSSVSDGDIVSVLSGLSGVVGNTFVLRHKISALVAEGALKITSNLEVVQFEV